MARSSHRQVFVQGAGGDAGRNKERSDCWDFLNQGKGASMVSARHVITLETRCARIWGCQEEEVTQVLAIAEEKAQSLFGKNLRQLSEDEIRAVGEV